MDIQGISISGNKKVAIIGVGYVGASIAYSLMLRQLANELVLISKNKEAVEAEVMDIRHGIAYMGNVNIHSGDYADIADSDLIIVSAGRNRRPNESRLDMAIDNIQIAKDVSDEIKKYYTRGVVLIVSNPVDIITYKMNEWLGLPSGRVFGTGCILDTSRLNNVIADFVGLSANIINSQVIGEHGDSQVALWDKVTVASIPINEYCNAVGLDLTAEEKLKMEYKVKTMGTEIIKGKDRTHYGIATCVCFIADSILNNRPTVASVSSVLEGEFGIDKVALSLPSVIDHNGVSRRLVEKIDQEGLSKLKESATKLQNLIKIIDQGKA